MSMKSVWVEAPFKEEGRWKTEKVKVGTTVKKIEKGLFIKKLVDEVVPVCEEQQIWEVLNRSDCEIDGRKFSENINQAIAELETEGYEVVSVTPVTSGRYKYYYEHPPLIYVRERGSFGWGYGFSYTEGVNILARLVKSV